jgi:hypothetical protein
MMPVISHGQENERKVEIEKQIKEADFPQQSLITIGAILSKSKNVRYYEEKSENNVFYEIKTKYKGEKLSIKFYEDGQLFDLEVLLKFEELPESIIKEIESFLTSSFKKHKVKRVQVQYSPEEVIELDEEEDEEERDEDLEEQIEFIEDFMDKEYEDFLIRYELEVEVIEKNKERGFYEFTFNHLGDLISKKSIVKRGDDNILY